MGKNAIVGPVINPLLVSDTRFSPPSEYFNCSRRMIAWGQRRVIKKKTSWHASRRSHHWDDHFKD